MKTTSLVILLILTTILSARTQSGPSADYYPSIKNYDLSKLWRSDSILLQDDGTRAPFPEPIGYIGEDFQRFDIHYLSVIKRKDNPYVYYVTGKTRVKDNICSFKGTLTILKAKLYKKSDDPRYKEGTVICAVHFREDSAQHNSGWMEGKLTTDFCLDKKSRLSYDAIMAVADGYYNNQCEAIWTSYITRKSKKCNWGDYRIPDNKGLDVGAGVFVADEKYKRAGWENFETDTTEWWKK